VKNIYKNRRKKMSNSEMMIRARLKVHKILTVDLMDQGLDARNASTLAFRAICSRENKSIQEMIKNEYEKLYAKKQGDLQ